jgi:hypothetical protein
LFSLSPPQPVVCEFNASAVPDLFIDIAVAMGFRDVPQDGNKVKITAFVKHVLVLYRLGIQKEKESASECNRVQRTVRAPPIDHSSAVARMLFSFFFLFI